MRDRGEAGDGLTEHELWVEIDTALSARPFPRFGEPHVLWSPVHWAPINPRGLCSVLEHYWQAGAITGEVRYAALTRIWSEIKPDSNGGYGVYIDHPGRWINNRRSRAVKKFVRQTQP